MRLVTRGDFDGLASGVLLTLAHDIDTIFLAKPHEIQENLIPISSNDIVANLPYHSDCGMWFDHHINEVEMAAEIKFKGAFKVAPSCSRVVFDYYKDAVEPIQRFEKIVVIADKIDSAQLSIEDIKNPHGWFIIERTLHAYDPLGRLGDFMEYFSNLIEWIKRYPLSTILLMDDVQNRIEHVRSEHKIFINALRESTHTESNVILTDTRSFDYFPNGNRFIIYTLYPEQNVSLSIFNARGSDQSVIFCGHNIFNRTCKTDVGALMARYGGSGRLSAGSCVVSQDDADRVYREICDELITNG
ncbi:MAG: hypothetical protein D6677_05180 [Calditrichaeota bacterium]|nr:MAG: hypothetical protein D6677_05180 [Calditrichota bacterium]